MSETSKNTSRSAKPLLDAYGRPLEIAESKRFPLWAPTRKLFKVLGGCATLIGAAFFLIQQHQRNMDAAAERRGYDLVQRELREIRGLLAAPTGSVDTTGLPTGDRDAIAKAVALIDRGQAGAARLLVDEMLRRYHHVALLFFVRGLSLGADGAWVDAATEFQAAIKLSPAFVECRFNLGVAFIETGKWAPALAAIDSALSHRRRFAEAWYNRGWVLDALGRWREAVASYDSALACRRGMADAWNNRGIALEHLGAINEALASYDSAAAYRPRTTYVWVNRGRLLGKQSRHSEALADFDLALSYNNHDPNAWLGRAASYAGLGEVDSAFASAHRALTLSADDWPSRHVVREFLRSLAGGAKQRSP